MGKDPTTEIRIECFEDFMSQSTILLLKLLFPGPFEFIAVIVKDSIESRLLGAAARIPQLLLPRSLPCTFHMGFLDRRPLIGSTGISSSQITNCKRSDF